MSNFVILTVRYSSTRLPGKCLLPFSSSQQPSENVLEHVINRAKSNDRHIIVCTGAEHSNDPIVQVCKDNNVDYFRGSDRNKIVRWYDCFREFNLDWAHFLDVDDPFFCNLEIEKSIESLLLSENVSLATAKSRSGNASVGITLSRSHLSALNQEVRSYAEFEMVEDLISQVFKSGCREIESLDPIPSGTRLTLDYFEDYIALSTLKALSETSVSRTSIGRLLVQKPWIVELNRSRNTEWRERQARILAEQRESNAE